MASSPLNTSVSEDDTHFDIVKCETVEYDEELFEQSKKSSSPIANGLEKTHLEGESPRSSPESPMDSYQERSVKQEHPFSNDEDEYQDQSHQLSDGAIDSDGETEETEEKKRKRTLYDYTTEQLQEALDLVQSQNVSILTASRQYGIPRSTLRRYALTVWDSSNNKVAKCKQETALTTDEEDHLVSMITKMSRAGKYVSTMDVKSTVQHLLDSTDRVVFKDRNRPNAGWVQRFRKRHKHLQIKGSGYTVKRQTPLTVEDVRAWHNELRSYLEKDWNLDIEKFFNKENGNRIFNLDEMSLPMNFKQDLIDESIPSGKIGDEIYSEVNILAAISASGEFTQPLIIQKGEGGDEDDIMPLDQNSYGISFSISGKMNPEIFLNWIEAFDRDLSEKGVEKPVVVFLDDIFSHFHISVFSYSIERSIILLCLPSQPTCIMHPIAAEFFDGVKRAYRNFCKQFYKEALQPVTMDQFPDTFLQAWESMKEEQGVSDRLAEAFESYGFVPLNHNATGLPNLMKSAGCAYEESLKLEGKKYVKIEPKAKKTIPPKRPRSIEPTVNLMPTVKIKKLDSTVDLKIRTDTCKNETVSVFKSPISGLEITRIDDGSLKEEKEIKPKNNISIATKSSVNNLSADRLAGRLDGMKKCIDLMESFVPMDILNVWKQRDESTKSSTEIPFLMWRATSNLCDDISSQINKAGKCENPPNKLLGASLLRH